MKKTSLLSLVLTFMKIGAFTFGGGYAMIPLIDDECVEKNNWITHDDLMNLTAIAESTPGPIAINCATYIGYQQAGLPGAILSTIAMIVPSFTIIFLISLFFDNILEITIVANAFKGIKIAVGVLIVTVGLKMLKKMHKPKRPAIIMSCSLIAMLLINIFQWRFSSIYIILTAGFTGYLSFIMDQVKNMNGGVDK